MTLTQADLTLLRFLSDHNVAVTPQVRRLLGVSHAAATRRLGILRRGGFLGTERPYAGRPEVHRPTAMGLRAAGSRFRARQIDHLSLDHDIGLGWLWLAAKRGVWGEMVEVVPERQMRSVDARGDPDEPTYARRTGGFGHGGRPKVHYPDLMLTTENGKRVAVELELSQKSGKDLEGVMSAYLLGRVDAVLYLVEDRGSGPAIGRAVETAARRWGLEDKIVVQRFRWGSEPPSRGAVLAAARAHVSNGGRGAER